MAYACPAIARSWGFRGCLPTRKAHTILCPSRWEVAVGSNDDSPCHSSGEQHADAVHLLDFGPDRGLFFELRIAPWSSQCSSERRGPPSPIIARHSPSSLKIPRPRFARPASEPTNSAQAISLNEISSSKGASHLSHPQTTLKIPDLSAGNPGGC